MTEDAQAAWILDSTDETFDADAIVRSHESLVIVDFWSETCQPCRLLTPILEQVVNEFQGAVLLVKVNTDHAPVVAQEFQVQAVPTVIAILDGEITDSFQGLIPEEDIRDWFSVLIRHKQLAMLKQLEETDAESAEQQYREILATDKESPHANIGLARSLAARGLNDEAMAIITQLEERGFLEPEAEKVKASLSLTQGTIDLPAARQAVAQRPDNWEAMLALSEALAASGEVEEAMEIALSLIQNDREATGKQAHQLMLNIFKTLSDDSDLVSTFRRRLAMTLY
jgi:putative thioredoxin